MGGWSVGGRVAHPSCYVGAQRSAPPVRAIRCGEPESKPVPPESPVSLGEALSGLVDRAFLGDIDRLERAALRDELPHPQLGTAQQHLASLQKGGTALVQGERALEWQVPGLELGDRPLELRQRVIERQLIRRGQWRVVGG